MDIISAIINEVNRWVGVPDINYRDMCKECFPEDVWLMEGANNDFERYATIFNINKVWRKSYGT